ncbi:hypothetical protein NEOLEDRAFT_1180334 [Neolentinus lepideus HHB14362 ss-1]|uniref:Uncharacterized protein n=1 Tax=Neolentinus lepideus HHB14362 ss-1 TaxID=1314782 RepID=A0A165QZI8_9AGAM|nr:hypothetical protein NEOLEDRAFT_1180334 [Neolentinus lepideus HHB14362 ss-1]
MPSEEKPMSSIRSATQKATVRPVEKRRTTSRLSTGASDAPASSQTPPPNRVPQTQQPLTTHFTPASHLPLDPDPVIQPVIRTMSEPQLSDDDTVIRSPYATSVLLPSEDDADYMDLESSPMPFRIQDPPDLVNAALGAARTLTRRASKVSFFAMAEKKDTMSCYSDH